MIDVSNTTIAVRILLLFCIFSMASVWLVYLAGNLPKDPENSFELGFPKSFKDLNELASMLKKYNQSHWWNVFVLFSSAYIYKQAFAIPGSVFLNILAGALYGTVAGTIITSIYAAFGASCCYLLSKQLFGVLITKFFSSKMERMRDIIKKQSEIGSLFSVLVSLRFFPMSPNWLMNMSAPLLGIQLPIFSLSVGIGLIPYNFICSQAGNIVSSITSVKDFYSYRVMGSMVLMAAVASIPGILKNRQSKVN